MQEVGAILSDQRIPSIKWHLLQQSRSHTDRKTGGRGKTRLNYEWYGWADLFSGHSNWIKKRILSLLCIWDLHTTGHFLTTGPEHDTKGMQCLKMHQLSCQGPGGQLALSRGLIRQQEGGKQPAPAARTADRASGTRPRQSREHH